MMFATGGNGGRRAIRQPVVVAMIAHRGRSLGKLQQRPLKLGIEQLVQCLGCTVSGSDRGGLGRDRSDHPHTGTEQGDRAAADGAVTGRQRGGGHVGFLRFEAAECLPWASFRQRGLRLTGRGTLG